jgi:hypothetical protein
VTGIKKLNKVKWWQKYLNLAIKALLESKLGTHLQRGLRFQRSFAWRYDVNFFIIITRRQPHVIVRISTDYPVVRFRNDAFEFVGESNIELLKQNNVEIHLRHEDRCKCLRAN